MKTNISTGRILTFLFGCILIRILLATAAYNAEKYKYNNLLIFLGIVTLLIGISFFTIYFDIWGRDNAEKQLQGWMDNDSKVWWNDLRPVHGALYILFSIFAFFNIKYAYLFLIIDVILGLSAWSVHHLI